MSACAVAADHVRLTIPLDVYGLPAGTCFYDVNGAVFGSFTLTGANKFTDDCDPALIAYCP